MGRYKYNMFDSGSFTEAEDQEGNYLNAHTEQMKADMDFVVKQGAATGGKWYLAKLNAAGDDDPQAAVGNFYYIYVPIDNTGKVLSGTYDNNGKQVSYKVATPCPPLCDNVLA